MELVTEMKLPDHLGPHNLPQPANSTLAEFRSLRRLRVHTTSGDRDCDALDDAVRSWLECLLSTKKGARFERIIVDVWLGPIAAPQFHSSSALYEYTEGVYIDTLARKFERDRDPFRVSIV